MYFKNNERGKRDLYSLLLQTVSSYIHKTVGLIDPDIMTINNDEAFFKDKMYEITEEISKLKELEITEKELYNLLDMKDNDIEILLNYPTYKKNGSQKAISKDFHKRFPKIDSLLKMLYVNNKLEEVSEDLKFNHRRLESLIKNTIWYVPPSFMTQFYTELSYYVKETTAIFRFQCLRLIKLYHESKNSFSNGEICFSITGGISFKASIINIEGRDKILIVGGNITKEELANFVKMKAADIDEDKFVKAKDEQFLNVDLERYVKEKLENFLDTYPFHRKLILVKQLQMYLICRSDNISQKMKLVSYVIIQYSKLLSEQGDKFESMIGEENFNVMRNIIFNYENSNFFDSNSLYKQCETLVESKSEKKILAKIPLCARSDRHYSLYQRFPFMPNGNINYIDIEQEIELDKNNYAYELSCSEGDSVCQADLKELENRIKKKYRFFSERFRVSEQYADQLTFNSIRHHIRYMPLDDIKSKISYLCRVIRNSYFVDRVSYFKYDSIDDTLQTENEYIAYNFKNNDSASQRMNGFTEKLNEKLIEWGENPEYRSKSILYSAIDGLKVAGRIKQIDNYEPFGEFYYKEMPEKLPLGEIEFLDEKVKDFLAIPIVFHGCKQGVILLESYSKDYFTHNTRLKLFEIKRTFDEEIFISLLDQTILEYYEKIGKKNGNNHQIRLEIFSEIIKKMALMFDFAGSMLFLKDDVVYKLVGHSGMIKNEHEDDLPSEISLFRKELEDLEIDIFNMWINISEFQPDSNINIIEKKNLQCNQNENPKYVNEIYKKFERVIVIKSNHTSEPNCFILLLSKDEGYFSNHLREQLNFYSKIVFQVTSEYFRQENRNKSMLSFVSHETISFIRAVENKTNTMKKKFLDDVSNKDDFELAIQDINNAAKQALISLSLISDNVIPDDIISDNKKLLEYYCKIKFSIEDFNLKELMKTQLHSFQEPINEKNITWDIKYSSFDRTIKFSYVALSHVIENLIVNVTKYGIDESTFKIKRKIFGNDLHLEFTNEGYRLDKSVEETHEIVFMSNKQGSKKRLKDLGKNVSGNGLGLYYTKEFLNYLDSDIELEYDIINENYAKYNFKIILRDVL